MNYLPKIERKKNQNEIRPNFDFSLIDKIKQEADKLTDTKTAVKHNEILKLLIDKIQKVDFRKLAELNDENKSLSKKHYLICSIEQILDLAKKRNWGICKHLSYVYLYNGAYWSLVNESEFQNFLGEAAEKMGVDKFEARHYQFQEQLYKQFLVAANLPKPEQDCDIVLINLKNGTFEISPQKQFLRAPRIEDFLTYQLPFEYNPDAQAPIFECYLNKVLPDVTMQQILAEYLAYIFIKPGYLKLEKILLLYGSGANGKSVFFDVVNAILGDENTSSYSLQSITDNNGYHRAMLGNKLLNYASEISTKLETPILKQMASGEPIEARLPYGEPFKLTNYAKLLFNCNELPNNVEQTNAFFRRLLIIPFEITIPEEEQDKELSKKIIAAELSGVFNWILQGLGRLLKQKNFTKSAAVNKQLQDYKKHSDSVQMFLEEAGYEKGGNEAVLFGDLFKEYISYCTESNHRSTSKLNFSQKLKNAGFETERKNSGIVVYIKKILFDSSPYSLHS